MGDEMKVCLTQLDEMLAQFTEIMSQLIAPSKQALVTFVAKLSHMFGEEDLPSSKED